MSLYNDIRAGIIGRIAITEPEADYLEKALHKSPGVHVEIGTLWGATAILAALAKGTGQVITIDYMREGYWTDGDPGADNKIPSPGYVLDNLARFGVAHRVNVVKTYSHPWPLPADLKPNTMFIDGDHDYAGVKADWEIARGITKSMIIFHDYGEAHPGVKRAVDEISDPVWKLKEIVGSLAVFTK